MPRLSDSMEEGTILRWLKADGDDVRRGEDLVEIETDKATMTYEADQDGVLEIVAAEGATLAIGEVIASIGERSGPNGGDPAAAAPAPAPKPEAEVEEPEVPVAGPVGEHGAATATTQDAPIPSIPAARPAPPPAAAPAEVAAAKGEVRVQELTRTQQVIARRMAEAKATVPEFTLEAEIDMDAAVRAREELRAMAAEEAVVPSYNDMIVKASALALREFPRANGAYRDGHFELFSRVNVGVAVAGEGSLVVPVVFDADAKPLGAIARETRALAARVRDSSITPPELSGGTFTVSNLGMYGISNFTAVINRPRAPAQTPAISLTWVSRKLLPEGSRNPESIP